MSEQKQQEVLDVMVVSRLVKNVEYREPIVSFDKEADKVTWTFDETERPEQLGDITFLYRVFVDKEGNAVNAKGIDEANAYLIDKALNGGKKDGKSTEADSKALAHFFEFLESEDLAQGKKRMQWDVMSVRKHKRPTYAFREHLKGLANIGVKNREDRTDDPLAISTVQSYMRAVVNFYKYHLKRAVKFENEPFLYEFVEITTDSTSASSMKGSQRFEVLTTDLRIQATEQKKKDGLPNKLRSLSKHEWNVLDEVIRKEGVRYVNKNGVLRLARIPIEFKHIFGTQRWTGLRREEVLSLREHQVFKPSKDQIKKGYVEIKLAHKSFNDMKNDKERVVEFPAGLMSVLHEYTLNSRYIQRRDKYEAKVLAKIMKAVADEPDFNRDIKEFEEETKERIKKQKQTPLFISQLGDVYSKGTLNARFSEIRKVVSERLGRPFTHKPHNLRATYAVFRMRELAEAFINGGEDPGKAWLRALDHVKNYLGHEDDATTAKYLRQAKDDDVSAEEVAEDVMEFADSIAKSNFELEGEDEW